MNISKVAKLFKGLYFRYNDDEVPALAAELAYYLLLSFFPFIILLVTIVGTSYISNKQILDELARLVPQQAFIVIRDTIDTAGKAANSGIISIGVLTTVWAASNGLSAVIRALNKAHDVKEARSFWKVKAVAVISTIALAFVILISFVLLIFGEFIGGYLVNWLNGTTVLYIIWNIVRYTIMLLVIGIIFAMLYRFMPCCRMKWREVAPGAIFATVGWISASLGFAVYVNNFVNYSKVYGSIGGAIVLMLWLYLSAIIIIVGGELNGYLAFHREGKDKPIGKKY